MGNFGSTAQEEYATKLAIRAGFGSLEEAADVVTGRANISFATTPFTKEAATKIITHLETRLGITKHPSKPYSADAATKPKKRASKRLMVLNHPQLLSPDT